MADKLAGVSDIAGKLFDYIIIGELLLRLLHMTTIPEQCHDKVVEYVVLCHPTFVGTY